MTRRRLSMIEKWAVAHKVGIEQAKQMLLTKAGIGRYGNRRLSPSSWPFWFLPLHGG
jgi:hypothetical protein